MSRERRRHRNESDALAGPDRLVEAGALFLLVFTPLAYGTVEPWSEAIAELVVLGMLVTWIAGMVLRHWELRVELPPGWLPAMLFLALVLFQLVPLPAGLAGVVSPLAVGLHQTAAAHTGATVSLVPVSLDPHATWREGPSC